MLISGAFILTFVLFITFGQKDLRVALPIISITNFIIYFLIGYSEKIRRGSTIFIWVYSYLPVILWRLFFAISRYRRPRFFA